MPSPNTLTKRRGKVYLGDRPISKALQPVAKPFFITEPETFECEYIDPVTGEECGNDGVIFSVMPVGGLRQPGEDRGVDLVCPEHVVAVMGHTFGGSVSTWHVALKQEV